MSGEPDDVVRSLREVEELTDRTRRAGLSAITGLPLLGWGLAMALYGIATSDRVFTVIAGSGVVVAGLSSMFVPEIALTVQGVLSGLLLAALGAVRMIRGGTRV
ncbi:hypothetical protein [Brevibacterium litoralis]|uniref:hypothetical protein n=1 Tax=Brevibacterium litoralis TaxID=3138935 RepID=UPI0032EC3067